MGASVNDLLECMCIHVFRFRKVEVEALILIPTGPQIRIQVLYKLIRERDTAISAYPLAYSFSIPNHNIQKKERNKNKIYSHGMFSHLSYPLPYRKPSSS